MADFEICSGFAVLAVVLWLNWQPANGSTEAWPIPLNQPIHAVPLVLASLLCLVSLLVTFVRWFFLVRSKFCPSRLPTPCGSAWLVITLTRCCLGQSAGT